MNDRSFIKSKSVLDRRQPSWTIFDYYCRQQSQQKSNYTFDDLQSNLHLLQIGKFGLILKQLGTNLTRKQVISMFQSHSSSHVMDYKLFQKALVQLSGHPNLNLDVEAKIKQLAFKIQNINRKKIQPSKYQFKVSSHSGKDTKEIMQQLEERKRRRLSVKKQNQSRRQKQRIAVMKKLGTGKFQISKEEISRQQISQLSQRLSQKSERKKYRSLNVSPKAQQVYIKSFLDDEQDEYLDSLYNPKPKKLIASKRQISLFQDSKLIADQINELQNKREIRNLSTINRQQLKKIQLGTRIINKYKT